MSTLINLLVYFSGFVYGFNKVSKIIPNDTYRYQSIVSLLASSILAPYSLWETYTFFMLGNISDSIRKQIHVFYLAYCLADAFHGLLYYPKYFTFLEGYTHHVMTGGYVLYCLYKNQFRPCCLAMVVEVPSVILFSSRVFADNKVVRWCKKKIFPFLFIFFRIILLGFFTISSYRANDIGIPVIGLYTGFSCLNLHWMFLLYKKNLSQDKPRSKTIKPL